MQVCDSLKWGRRFVKLLLLNVAVVDLDQHVLLLFANHAMALRHMEHSISIVSAPSWRQQGRNIEAAHD